QEFNHGISITRAFEIVALYWRTSCLAIVPMSSEDKSPEDIDFAKTMRAQGVVPLKKTSRVLVPSVSEKSASLQQRREQAGREPVVMPSLGDSVREWLGPHDIIEFRRPGLQHGTFKDFKQGKLRPAATL